MRLNLYCTSIGGWRGVKSDTAIGTEERGGGDDGAGHEGDMLRGRAGTMDPMTTSDIRTIGDPSAHPAMQPPRSRRAVDT